MTSPVLLTGESDEPRALAPTMQQVMANTDLAFLDSRHKVYEKNLESWKREERRLAGGDAVLSELTQFDGERATSFEARKRKATYVNFPKMHATTVTGRLRVHAPMPNYGKLGEVRSRDKIDTPTFAELVHYNVDGTGNDGSEMPVFFDAVDVRAQATGHRWLFWEAPEKTDDGPITLAKVQAGFRPYVVEWSPIDVPNWYVRHGQLQFAIVRVETSEPFDDGAATSEDLGYYLFVRRGYEGFGPAFADGGWWLFDSKKAYLRSGNWNRTKGQIPMWIHFGDTGTGTTDWPAISQSSTMELGQIAVALMDAISDRDSNAHKSASGRTFFLGASPTVMQAVASQVIEDAVMVGVPPAPSTTGDAKTEHIVNIWHSSQGAVEASVYSTIIDSKFNEAQQQSILQATSVIDSSGVSKDMGDRAGKSPLLARRAAMRQASEQAFVYFGELRFGFLTPTGSVVWPTEFELRPLVDDITAALDRLRRTVLKSPTLEVDLTMQGLEEDGFLTDDNREVIRSELLASAKVADEIAAMDRALLGGGTPTLRLEPSDEPDVTEPEAADAPVAPIMGDGTAPPVTEPLNGAQITAAKEVMLSLRAAIPAERLSPEAAVELLVLVGVPREAADQMVAAQMATIQVAEDVDEEEETDEEDDEGSANPPAPSGTAPPRPRSTPPALRQPEPAVAELSAKLDQVMAAIAARPEPVAPTPPPAPPIDIPALVNALRPGGDLTIDITQRDEAGAMKQMRVHRNGTTPSTET